MSYGIRDKEYHQSELDRIAARDSQPTDIDNCVSNWGSDTMVDFHRKALKIIEANMMDEHAVLLEDAGPALLDALEAILPIYKDWTDESGHDPSVGIENAVAAIAQAKGEA